MTSAALKILFITNASSERCGVKEYGEQMVAAIRHAGHQVEVWDGTYSTIYHNDKRYLPDSLAEFDLLHLNWDPQTINHYLPEHFAATGKPLSLFLHDVPPNSMCPVAGIARWTFAFEPMDGAMVVPEAIPWMPSGPVSILEWVPHIGVTGIRSDPGMDMVQEVCAKNGWIRADPLWWHGGPWLSTTEEIHRLAQNHVNVCWYQTSGRGKSMAAMFCCAARRPVVLSDSTMFSALWDYGDELYILGSHEPRLYNAEVLTEMIKMALKETPLTRPKIPTRVCAELSWERVIQPVIAAWQDGLKASR